MEDTRNDREEFEEQVETTGKREEAARKMMGIPENCEIWQEIIDLLKK